MKKVDSYTEAIRAYRRANNTFQQAKVAHLLAIEESEGSEGPGDSADSTCLELRAACRERWNRYRALENERQKRNLIHGGRDRE